jgi:hypothetical protein
MATALGVMKRQKQSPSIMNNEKTYSKKKLFQPQGKSQKLLAANVFTNQNSS